MATFEQFVERYGDDYDNDAELAAGYQLHEENRSALEAIFAAAALQDGAR